MYTGKRRSFKVTPGKLEDLQESLVEMRETLVKGGKPIYRRLVEVKKILGKIRETLRKNRKEEN